MRFKTQEIFSVFGDYEEYLTGPQFPTDTMFAGYTKNLQEERLPNGDRHNILRYSKGNLTVGVRFNRIDIAYGFNNQYCNDQEFIEQTLDILSKFSNFEPGICGNRIALNVNEFIPEKDLDITKKLSQVLGVSDLYGSDSDEFMMRINHVKHLETETFNSILSLQNAKVQNNQTRVTQDAMAVNTDINTVVENRNMRFDFDSLADLLMVMVSESEERKQKLFDKIGYQG